MQYINKKHILLPAILFSVLLAGCNNSKSTEIGQHTGTQITTGEVTNTGTNPSGNDAGLIYLSGYVGNSVTITNDISGAIVTQTSDTLLYKNEVYGFQMLLTQKAKGVKIKDWTLSQSGNNGTTINSHYVSLYWDAKAVLGDNYYDSNSISYKHKTYQRLIDIQVMETTDYNNIIDFNGMPGVGRKPLEESTLGHNDKYYFVLSAGNAGHDSLAKWIPTLTCKDIMVQTTKEKDCGNWIAQLMTGFKTFNIK